MRRAIHHLCVVALVSLGCAEADPQPSDPADPPSDPTNAGWFAASPPANGPRLWLEAVADDDTHLALYGADLGNVFGWSVHVGSDPDAAELAAPTAAGVLGDDSLAARLTTVRDARVLLAETRRSPQGGGVDVNAPTRLATIDVVRAAASATIDLEDVIVRRTDGSYVAVKVAGGTVTTEVSP